ncbi:hypothetical protein N0V88_007061 [Collariella sp. IMI 366227]|nr:hypothetical protein N0V88_007061 [Collariella sp. IMI 366227]
MANAGLLQAFLAAIQASLSVLLVMSYGGLAAHFKFIDRAGSKPISKLCVHIFLPALLITKLGAELSAHNIYRYAVVAIWGIVCHAVSFALGMLGQYGFKMPDYTSVAIFISNTTSYPLLLVTALEETGILASLVGSDESTKDAIERAKSYFLVFSTISNILTFSVGVRLIDNEDGPSSDDDEDDKSDGEDGHAQSPNPIPGMDPDEQTRLLESQMPRPRHPSRSSSFFLPQPKNDHKPEPKPDKRRPWFVSRKRWQHMSARAKWWLLFVLDFFNAPLLGAVLGVIIGLIPALHRAFFNSSEDGGIFTAWLTASLKTVGGLFVSLPVVVAGITLFCSTREAKQNNESVMNMPWLSVGYILTCRFIVWPCMSIPIIYFLASRTGLLGDDPILWFCLMIMPCGPSAMKLITLVQVAGASKDDEVHISRLLTISYIISPILSLTIAGSLLASQAAIKS